MTFKIWLTEIGKSEGTADKYSRAVSGVISSWAQDAGLSSLPLDEIETIAELVDICDGLDSVDIYIKRNEHGNNMYSCAVKAYIEFRKCRNTEELEQDLKDIIDDDSTVATEKAALINTRIGQGRYRNKLIGYWGECALTGYSDVRLLVASHIKPWRASSAREKLDQYNGLLLLPNLDKVFDLGFITFSEMGDIIVSAKLEDMSKLGIHSDMRINLDDSHQPYMEFHRKKVYERAI